MYSEEIPAPYSFVLVDGVFDPIHDGHIEYLEEATKFGLPVYLNITFGSRARSKHKEFLRYSERAKILGAIRFVNGVLPKSDSTSGSLSKFKPAIYFKGKDWSEKLPEVELNLCKKLKIKVEFASTQKKSSTKILNRFLGKK